MVNLTQLAWQVIIFILSSIPLYLAVKFLGGKTGLLNAAFISFIAGIVVSFIASLFNFFGGIIAFLVLVWIYHEAFRLKWWKAFIVWLVQLAIIFLFYFILALFGIALVGISLLS